MQLFQVAVILSLIFTFEVSALSKEKERDIIRGLLTECKDKEGGTQEDFDMLLREEFPETPTSKCMTACSLEILGVVSCSQSFVLFLFRLL